MATQAPTPDTRGTGSAGTSTVDAELLRRVGLDAGLDAVGVAPAVLLEPARSVLPLRRAAGLAGTMQFTYKNPERSTDPARVLRGATTMVVGLLSYRRADRPPSHHLAGRVARYAWDDWYGQLRGGLAAIAAELERAGYRARIVADSNDLVDRNAAWLAGLAWYGKNTNLLNRELGSWFVVGTVVTDADFGPSPIPESEPMADGCGSCSACLTGCPTGALVAPGVLDARRCIAWLVQAGEPIPAEFRAAVGDRIYGCDICQEVCPANQVTLHRNPPAAERWDAPSDGGRWVDIAWALDASDEELLARYGRWYIANRDPDVIRRTALVVLGNVGGRGDPAVERLVERYLADPNPLLRAHAVWAARRLGLSPLIELLLAEETDPMVRAELEANS